YSEYELVPARIDSDAEPIDYPRDLAPTGTTTVNFTSTTRSPMLNIGVQPGDVLQVFEEVFMLGSTGSQFASSDHQLAVQSLAGSNLLTALPSVTDPNPPFNTGMVGDLLFI